MSGNPSTDTGKSYHLQCTGDALETVKAHNEPKDITLFGSCFCPFVQRAWVTFEYLGIDYYYYEVDPYKKPAELLEVSPKGLVPGLKLNNYQPPRSVNESTVIIEFLEDIAATTTKRSLLPPITDPYARALIRLQADHVNRSLIPAFYRYLQAQDQEKQIEGGKEFIQSIEGLIKLFERQVKESESKFGLWNETGVLSLADVMAGPWLFRATNVLPHYRGFPGPGGPKITAYIQRIINHPAFKKTCSLEDLYIDSYERALP